MLRDVYGVAVALLMSFGLAYFALAMGLGTFAERRMLRQANVAPSVDQNGQRVAAGSGERADAKRLFVLIPCRDEETVIGDTIAAMLAQDPRVYVFVIDDGSTDATAEVVRAAQVGSDGNRVLLVSRVAPNVRLGKGPALNAGFAALQRFIYGGDGGDIACSDVFVCVMDADGQLSPGAVSKVLPVFDDLSVGGVQLPVEIRNQDGLVAQMVQFEFWGYSAISQFGRTLSRTVSLGGNGQFTRFVALEEIGDEPWSRSLTEDLDLSITLAMNGWSLTTVAGAAVNQQAVDSIRKYIKQRARWFQGHMSVSLRIPQVWRSNKLSNLSMLELVSYLILPFGLVLPWSILGQVALYDFVRWLSLPSFRDSSNTTRVFLFAFAYLFSFLPNFALALLYWRRSPNASWWSAFKLAHLTLVFNYLSYIAAWLGFWRLIRGRTAWDKTVRVQEKSELSTV